MAFRAFNQDDAIAWNSGSFIILNGWRTLVIVTPYSINFEHSEKDLEDWPKRCLHQVQATYQAHLHLWWCLPLMDRSHHLWIVAKAALRPLVCCCLWSRSTVASTRLPKQCLSRTAVRPLLFRLAFRQSAAVSLLVSHLRTHHLHLESQVLLSVKDGCGSRRSVDIQQFDRIIRGAVWGRWVSMDN